MSVEQKQDASKTADPPPELIQLRLPAALLSSLKASRLTLNIGNKDDKCSISVCRSGANQGIERVTHPLQIGNQSQTQWYRYQASKSPSDSETKKLVRIGTTKHSYTINNPKQPKADFDLKRIGEKTRKLLDQERKKRKEIVCLKDDELPPLAKETAAAGANAAKTPGAGKEKTKPAAAAKSSKKRVGTKRKRNDPTIDGWMPDTDHLISEAVNKEDRSSILRLHGLPIGTAPDHIRKFFHGLNPSNVFVLPTLDRRIEGWDAKEDTSKCIVRRHPNSFRVFVKFQSVLVADAAMERLGESIGFDSSSGSVEKNGVVVGAAVSMSPVPKHVASHLQRHLAISTRKGEPIIETLTAAEKRIRGVADFAWIMTAKKLKLKSLEMRLNSTRLQTLFQHHSIPRSISQYNSLVKVYNRLIDEHEKMEMDSSLLLMHTFDPSCLDDSAHRITQSVSHWLLDEIGVLERNLCESRLIFRGADGSAL